MAFRTDLTLTINTEISFKDFDAGKRIFQHVPASWNVTNGDAVKWAYGRLSGQARIVACGTEGNKLSCTFEKIFVFKDVGRSPSVNA